MIENVLAQISGQKSRRAFLTSHVPGSASTVMEPQKENSARGASFYLDNLDRRSRAIQWTKRGAPELTMRSHFPCEYLFSIFHLQAREVIYSSTSCAR
jgi:hypothetical protein